MNEHFDNNEYMSPTFAGHERDEEYYAELQDRAAERSKEDDEF